MAIHFYLTNVMHVYLTEMLFQSCLRHQRKKRKKKKEIKDGQYESHFSLPVMILHLCLS